MITEIGLNSPMAVVLADSASATAYTMMARKIILNLVAKRKLMFDEPAKNGQKKKMVFMEDHVW